MIGADFALPHCQSWFGLQFNFFCFVLVAQFIFTLAERFVFNNVLIIYIQKVVNNFGRLNSDLLTPDQNTSICI